MPVIRVSEETTVRSEEFIAELRALAAKWGFQETALFVMGANPVADVFVHAHVSTTAKATAHALVESVEYLVRGGLICGSCGHLHSVEETVMKHALHGRQPDA